MKDRIIEDNRKLYGLDRGLRRVFLDINNEGHLVLRTGEHIIDLYKVVRESGLESGYIRVYTSIKYMLDKIHGLFRKYSSYHGFRGEIKYIYPLKTNSLREVVERIWRYGSRYGIGFNTGSYRELKILEEAVEEPSIIVIDGLKDRKVIELAEKFKDNGWRVYIDIESPSEVERLRTTDIDLGLRIKMLSPVRSRWYESTGLDSKFGLNLSEAMKLLDDNPWLNKRIKLLHVHPGSQVEDLESLTRFFDETARIYNGLRDRLDHLYIIDVGGGIAYPYDPYTVNYTLDDYIDKLLSTATSICDSDKCPTIFVESGRIIASFHRIVFGRVVDVRPYTSTCSDQRFPIIDKIRAAGNLKELNTVIREAREILTRLLSNAFRMDRGQRIMLEQLESCIRENIVSRFNELYHVDNSVVYDITHYPNYLLEYLTSPSHRFMVNTSLFRDIPDHLIINQYFQVIPLQRLDEYPEVVAVISDATCDSMGEYRVHYTQSSIGEILVTGIDKRLIGVPGRVLKVNGIPLHLPRRDEDYYIAILETGAYQDMLAMDHNQLEIDGEIIIDECNGEPCISIRRGSR